MDAVRGLELRTNELSRYVDACERALDLVADFASDELIHSLFCEITCLETTAAIRALPERRLHRS